MTLDYEQQCREFARRLRERSKGRNPYIEWLEARDARVHLEEEIEAHDDSRKELCHGYDRKGDQRYAEIRIQCPYLSSGAQMKLADELGRLIHTAARRVLGQLQATENLRLQDTLKHDEPLAQLRDKIIEHEKAGREPTADDPDEATLT